MLTIIDAGRAVEVDARVDGQRVLLSSDALRDALGWEVTGFRRGWEGVMAIDPADPASIAAHSVALNREAVRGIDRAGGTVLHTSRRDPRTTDEGDRTGDVLKVLEALGVDAMITLGGDGTLRFSAHLSAQGVPVVFDVTHSLQLPGAGNGVTAGQAEYIEPLAAAGSPRRQPKRLLGQGVAVVARLRALGCAAAATLVRSPCADAGGAFSVAIRRPAINMATAANTVVALLRVIVPSLLRLGALPVTVHGSPADRRQGVLGGLPAESPVRDDHVPGVVAPEVRILRRRGERREGDADPGQRHHPPSNLWHGPPSA